MAQKLEHTSDRGHFQDQPGYNGLEQESAQDNPQVDTPPVVGKQIGEPENKQNPEQTLKSLHRDLVLDKNPKITILE
jgi:hypothetical protein